MKFLFSGRLLSGLLLAACCNMQTAANAQPVVRATWDTSARIAELSAQAVRLKPLLDQLAPQDWLVKGASPSYVTQWRDAKLELEYLATSAAQLEKQPDKLTTALDTYFRLQSLETRLDSLIEGVRKYHNPAVGDLILGVVRANSANRDGLRQYITDLATQRELELSVMDEEAQRCRLEINKPSKAAPARSKGK